MVQAIIIVGAVCMGLWYMLCKKREQDAIQQELPITEATVVYPQEEKDESAVRIETVEPSQEDTNFTTTLKVKRPRAKRTGYVCANCKNFDPIKPIKKPTKKEQ